MQRIMLVGNKYNYATEAVWCCIENWRKMYVPMWERCRLQGMFPYGNMDQYASACGSVSDL